MIKALAGGCHPIRLPPPVLTGYPNHHEAPRQGRLHPMARYALCVGINEFKSLPRSSWLSGCVNDANDISKALKKQGFPARNVQVITDKEATKKKVMSRSADDGGQGQAGGPRGVLVLEPRDAGAEPARRPGRAGRPRRGLRLLRPQAGRRGLGPQDRHRRRRAARCCSRPSRRECCSRCVLDTCHSGTGTKDLDDMQQAMLLGRRPRFLPPPTRKGLTRARSIREARPRKVDRKALVELTSAKGPGAKPVLYAACRPDQTAADARFDDRSNGAFTYLLLKALAQDPRRPGASCRAPSPRASRARTSSSARRWRARPRRRRWRSASPGDGADRQRVSRRARGLASPWCESAASCCPAADAGIRGSAWSAPGGVAAAPGPHAVARPAGGGQRPGCGAASGARRR